MTEHEKMISGMIYNSNCPELREKSNLAKKLIKKYNNLTAEKIFKRNKLLKELLGSYGKNTRINQPFYVDYGRNIFVGDNCIINLNCTFLDTNKIEIGDFVLIAPNVKIYTSFHPMNIEKRFKKNENGDFQVQTISSAVKIGNCTWIGGASIILPGVNIGNNVIIGAGSVVTKSIPDNVIAYGNPCRVIKENISDQSNFYLNL